MTYDRRTIWRAGLAAGGLGGLGALGLAATPADASPRRTAARTTGPEQDPAPATTPRHVMTGAEAGLVPDAIEDQSTALQAAIDQAATHHATLQLAPGRYRVADVTLRAGTRIDGSDGAATLALSQPAPILRAQNARGLAITDITLDGAMLTPDGPLDALLSLEGCDDIRIARATITASGARGIALERCSGRVLQSRIATVKDAALFALDSRGLDIIDNHITECGNNGILVWRSAPGEDGSIIARNRITRVSAFSGGSGQNGNAINVFRAGNVIVEGNRITDCAYSAVRGNAASNLQIIANSCQRIGEVALYAEFAFEGVVIAHNLVDGAAAGISVTNFNEGGRLAVVQGNLIRNLKRREHENIDKRGEGISVEADASVTGNVVENASTAGLVIGWGPYMRNVAATGNMIRDCAVGIMVSADPQAGACLISANMISGTRDGAIRLMHQGRVAGPDLARDTAAIAAGGRIAVSGNVAV